MRSTKLRFVATLALALCPAIAIWSASAVADETYQRNADVVVFQDGRVVVHGRGAHDATTMSSDAMPAGLNACQGFNAATRVSVGAEPKTSFARFMRVANWLEDCGVRDLLVLGRVPSQLAVPRIASVELVMGDVLPLIVCPPVEAGVVSNCPKPKVPPYVSLHRDGSLDMADSAEIRPTTEANMASDLENSVKRGQSKAGEVLIRADRDVSYSQFVELLDQLDRKGFNRLELINEDI